MTTRTVDQYNRIVRKGTGFVVIYHRMHRTDPNVDYDIDTDTVETREYNFTGIPGVAEDAFKPGSVAEFLFNYGCAKVMEDRQSQECAEDKLEGRAMVHAYLMDGHIKNPDKKQRGAQQNWLAEAISHTQGCSVGKAVEELAKYDKAAKARMSRKFADTIAMLKAKAAGESLDLDTFLDDEEDAE